MLAYTVDSWWFSLAGHAAEVGGSAHHAVGNGVLRVPHGRTLDWATVKETCRVLNTDMAQAPQAHCAK